MIAGTMSGLLRSVVLGGLLSGLIGGLAWGATGIAGGGRLAEARAAVQVALTSQEQATLRQGRVLLTGEDGNYTARVMANGSVDTAWAVLTDYNNFANFLPGVESSRLLESNGDQRQFEQVNVVRIFPITHRERTVIAATESYPSKIAFSMVDGDLQKLQGAWTITGAGEQVMITHQVVVEPASNRSIFFAIYKDNLQKTMAALKQEIERR
jgi:ribosome-associated toxin RatA of RatAB toxin-antitoxin module